MLRRVSGFGGLRSFIGGIKPVDLLRRSKVELTRFLSVADWFSIEKHYFC